MKKWEYKVVDLNCLLQTDGLNKLGQEGWELVSVTKREAETTAYLKREIPESLAENKDENDIEQARRQVG